MPYKRYITKTSDLPLTSEERARIQAAADRYPFRLSDHYARLINWSDPADPLRAIAIPDERELEEGGRLDPSGEATNSKAKGLQHKYPTTALLLVNDVCGAYCRYCFRKRLFQNDNDEATHDVSEGIRYIEGNDGITNVLLTGGDPLLLSNGRLKDIVCKLCAIDSIRIIRIGTKMLAFDPARFDSELFNIVKLARFAGKIIYFMNHFDHPREITSEAARAMEEAQSSGAILVNQCPILRGVNDSARVLESLFNELSYLGCPQYYVFQGRPVVGNAKFNIPIVKAFAVFDEARKRVGGLAKRAKFVMSHDSGKIEVVGLDSESIYLHYHSAKDQRDEGRFMRMRRDDSALWLDELRE